MIDPISFTVDMAPTGKGRPRHTRSGHVYTPKATVDAEAIVAKEARKHFAAPLVVPVAVRIEAYYAVPKSYSKSKRVLALTDEIKPQVKPDIDNIAKLILDAMNGIAWSDDKAVTDLRIIKRYADKPFVFVKVGEA